MTIPFYKFIESLNTDDIIRCHLYFSCIKKGCIPEKGEIELLLFLYKFGEINSKERNNEFLKSVVENKLRASEASARNVLSKYTSLGVLVKEGNSKRKFDESIFPKDLDKTQFAIQYIYSNYSFNENRT